jgi:NAD(P)-dependent dehydrogenase (short-subunit alcohol dehydrogenase family)
MANKTIVFITGANTGLGYEAVKALYKSDKPYEILLGSRDVSKGDEAISTLQKEVSSSPSAITTIQIDIESDDSIQKAYDTITSKYGKVDTLINNAGAGFDRQIQEGNMGIREAWLKSWNVNVAGTQVMTTIFVPLLLKSKKPQLMFVTSGTSALSETEKFDYPPLARLNKSPPAGWPKDAAAMPITSYRSTKTGLNMMMREWTKMLKEDGVKVWAISPGFLATGLGGVGAEQLKKVSTLL